MSFYSDLEDGLIYRLLSLKVTTNHLIWAIARANILKASYNAHIASMTYHQTADTTNAVTSPDATDLSSLITLINEFRTDYEAHRILVGAGPVHGSADTVHAVTADPASDLDSAVTLIKDLHLRFEAHREDISGTLAIHVSADTSYILVEYMKKIEPFGGNIEDILEMKRKLSQGSPTIFVQAQGSNPKQIAVDGTHYRDARVAVLLIDRSSRGQEKQRRGSGHGGEPPGIYQMVEDVCDLIVGMGPVDGFGRTLQAGHWRILEERTLHNDLDMQVWLLVFATKVAHQWAQINRSTLNDLQRTDGEGDLYEGDTKVYDGMEKLHNEWPQENP